MNRGAETPDTAEPGSGAVIRGKFRLARALMASVRPEPQAEAPRISRTRSDRLARQLALAHWIERAVESGQVASYGEVARALGLTESRITQITALLGLAPAVQECVLFGEKGIGIREAIRVGREVEWGAEPADSSACAPISTRAAVHRREPAAATTQASNSSRSA